MRTYNFTAVIKAALRVACMLPFAAVPALGQQTVNLTAGPATAILPDGSTVPMWGYSCGAAVTAVTSSAATTTFTATGASDTSLAMPINAYAGSTVTAGTSSGTVLSNTATTLTLTAAGWTGGIPVSGTFTLAASKANCAALNKATTAGVWSPVVITVPTGQDLTINLTNNLSFTPPSIAIPNPNSPNNIPTSLVIVGQLGGGLGASATYSASSVHANQFVAWSTVGNSTGATFVPPPQGQRVQSFGTEVAATPATTAQTPTALTWKAPRAGTYLIESGTHPSIQGPMGLYGILVVTSAPTATAGTETAAGLAYPGVPYDADVPLLFSEIDPAQNNAVNKAVNTVGFSETAVITLKDSVSSVILTPGGSAGSGYAVGDVVTFPAGSGGGVGATAQVAHVTSTGAIIDFTVTNSGVGYTSVPTGTITSTNPLATGAQFTAVLSLAGDLCGTGFSACYPPAVNYTPLYYAINGAAFNKTNSSASLFSVTPATLAPLTGPGSVLVRFVNAGLRMHVPSIVGSQTAQQMPAGTASKVTGGFSIIAEDGNPLPGLPRVQSEVFMAAGKTFDVMINAPAACTPVVAGGACTTPALPVYDRELSLSGNAIGRDAGMLAYISVNGSVLPTSGVLGAAVARQDTYNSVIPCTVAPCKAVTVSDPSKGVIANDTNVYGVAVAIGPTGGTVTLNTDGTFTYVPNVNTTSDSFTYCANGTTPTSVPSVCAPVTLGACAAATGCLEAAGGITVNPITYTSKLATYLNVRSPGVLSVDTDSKDYPLSVNMASVTPVGGLTLSMDSHGGFNASVTAAGTYTFTYKAQKSQGTVSANAATVTLNFPAGSGLAVTVLDGYDKTTTIADYRWIIEEDKSFYINPNCTRS